MAVTFHNATVTAGPASVGTATILHTISGADACLLVFTHANTAVSFSAIAANGLQLTRLGHISASSSRAEVWGLSAAPVATLSISANVVGAASLNFCLVAVSYIGQVQVGGSPFGTVVAGTAQGVANVAFSVSSTSTDLVVYGFGISANTTVAFNTGTSRGNTTHTTTGRLVVGEITGAATISISATAAAAGVWSFLGVPIVASAAAVTGIRFDNGAYTGTATVAPNSVGLLLTATAKTCLLVWINLGGGSQTVSSVAVGTTQLGFLGGVNYRAAAAQRVELWGLTAAPTGILTISAVLVGAQVTTFGIGAVTYTGAKINGNPFGGIVTGSASSTAEAGLVISSTLGNVVVAGFGVNTGTESAGPGTVQRVNAPGSFPVVLILDVPGFTNASVSAASTSTTSFWGMIGINLIQGATSGIAAMTDVRDTLSATGYVLVSGRLSATDVTDKFSASGYVVVTGRLSATGAADRLSATGYVVVSGRLSATDVTDKFSASGYVLVSGRMSATDVTDIFSASGNVLAVSNFTSGTFAATDRPDTFLASGYTLVTGRLSATDVTDKFSASGYVIVSASVNFTDRPDIFAASGTVIAVSTPAVVVTPDTTSLGGKREKKTDYFRADDAFWEAREKYLLSLQPAIASEPEYEPSTIHAELPNTIPSPIDPSLLIQYRAARSKLITSIPQASTMRQLQAQGKRLYEVNARIAEQKRQQALYDAEQTRLTLARLRKVEREKRIRRIKRRVVLLAAARAAVALTYLIDKL